MSTPTQMAAALRFMEMATDTRKLAKARETYKQAHGADLLDVFHEAGRELEKSGARHGV